MPDMFPPNFPMKARRIRESLTLPFFIFVTLLVVFSSKALADSTSNNTQDFDALIQSLPDAKLRAMPDLVNKLVNIEDERVLPVVESMLAGKLYFVRSSKAVVSVTKQDSDNNVFIGQNVLSGETLDPLNKKEIKKIRVNNRVRKALRKAIAQLTLFSPDDKQRNVAVDNLLNNLNDDNVALLKQAKEVEQKKSILKKIDIAIAVHDLSSDDIQQRKQAIKKLSGELHPVVRNRLALIVEKDDEGNFIEQDAQVIMLTEQALKKIEGRLQFYGFLERVFFGLSLGSVLLLAAIGLSITFGVMGVINMAHGELLMLGAYTTYVIQQLMPNHIGLSIFVAIPSAFVVCALVGIAIERGVIQFLKGRPLETLLATFGLSLILQQSVRSIFSPLNRQVSTPEWMSGVWQINPGFALTYNRLYIIIFSLVIFFILLLVMKKTVLGLYVRAVSQNRDMAKAVGIRSEWVDAMTFGLGSGIAGVAGVALSQLTNVGPNLGQAYIIDSFMVVVFGGVGNLWGTLVGAFSLGVVGKFLEPVTGTVLAQILVLIFIVLFIQKRPRGLFPQKGRAAE